METNRARAARRKILLIDDNRSGLRARRSVLEGLGFEVATAESGEEGLALFRSTAREAPFSLIVTDYRMPGIRGDEVVRQLREIAPDIPLVILSGYANTLALDPESTGADIVLAKGPREQFDLMDAVTQLVPEVVPGHRKPPATETVSAKGRLEARRHRRASAG